MKRRAATLAIAAITATIARPSVAQPARPYRVAWVSAERKNVPSANLEAFRGGLRELGYVEGRDLIIETWLGEGSSERVSQMVPAMLAWQPDLIVASSGLALFPLTAAGVKLPIVFSISADPVEGKVVESYARPGGNVTGISLFTLALVGKRMELLKEVMPGVKRIAVIANNQHPGEHLERDAARAAAAAQGLALRYFSVSSEAGLEAALADIARARDDAILAFADGFTMGFAGRIAEFSLKHRIPAIDGWAQFAKAGNLLTYGPVGPDVYRRLASYADRIRKGAKPGDLPVELPIKVELVINERTAKALGITVPPSVLARADEVIR